MYKNKELTVRCHCHACNIDTNMTVINTHELQRSNLNELAIFNILSVIQCPSCNIYGLVKFDCILDSDIKKIQNIVILYPKPLEIPMGLPSSIEEAFTESQKVKDISALAYSGLVRKILEIICDEKGIKTNNLHTALNELADTYQLPKVFKDIAHDLRNMGNAGMHIKEYSLTMAEVPLINAMIRALLEYLYTAPFLAEEAKKAFENLKGKTTESEIPQGRGYSPGR